MILLLFLPLVNAQLLTEENLKVAFFADMGYGEGTQTVLSMTRAEGVDLVLIAGDFDNVNDSEVERWDALITNFLGDDIPLLGTAGNHDAMMWHVVDGFQDKLEERLALIYQNQPGAITCEGPLGEASVCNYRGLNIISSAGGITGLLSLSEHNQFIQESLESSESLWNICSWHKLMEEMQISTKHDEMTWAGYDLCKDYGALIISGHSHSYARTHMLNDMDDQVIADSTSPYELKNGQTMNIVSANGGIGARAQTRCLPYNPPYGCNGEWAVINTYNQQARAGALYCTFYVDGIPNKASCYYKDINGVIIDEFDMINTNYEPNPDLCIDTDSGFSPGAQGTVSYGGVNYTDYCRRNILVEYYCNEPGQEPPVLSSERRCPGGCRFGACQQLDIQMDTYGGRFSDKNTYFEPFQNFWMIIFAVFGVLVAVRFRFSLKNSVE